MVKKSGKRAKGNGHTNLTLFQKREKTEGKLGRDVKYVFERGGGGGRTCKRPFLMVAEYSCCFSCCSTIPKECRGPPRSCPK